MSEWADDRIIAIAVHPELHRHYNLAAMVDCCFEPGKGISEEVVKAHNTHASLPPAQNQPEAEGVSS